MADTTKSAGRKVNLAEGIMFRGKVYGPGKGVPVPSDFPDPKQLAEKRKVSSARNAQTPMTVSTGGKPEPQAAGAEGGAEGEGAEGGDTGDQE